MKTSILMAIVKKDLLEVKQNTSVMISIIVVPLIFLVILPLILMTVFNSSAQDPAEIQKQLGELGPMVQNIPPSMSQYLAPWNDFQKLFVLSLGMLLAPMFLILPLMAASAIASESFAGERERKTMEALLYTAASDAELFVGKVLAAFLPALALTWLSFAGYTIVLNTAGWPVFGQIWFPLSLWWPLIFWVSPALAALGIAITVLISVKTHSFMGAYQTSASVVLLVVGLMAGQVTGVMYLSVSMGWILGAVLWVAAGGLAWFAVRTFNRPRLLL
jgi:ABC-2 type transport system permease protein